MTARQQPLRFGLVGTGYWAQVTHAPALVSTEGIEFAAVWGRNPDAARSLAATYQATAHSDMNAFLADIDAVAFSVPPDAQNAIAIRAASAGKHLLLEKPVGTSVAEAERLARTVRQARVASVVFFTARFRADVRDWLADVTSRDGWAGGWAIWLGSSLLESSRSIPCGDGTRAPVGSGTTRSVAAVRRSGPGSLRYRRRRPRRRHASCPAP
jgi:hypothetical protein